MWWNDIRLKVRDKSENFKKGYWLYCRLLLFFANRLWRAVAWNSNLWQTPKEIPLKRRVRVIVLTDSTFQASIDDLLTLIVKRKCRVLFMHFCVRIEFFFYLDHKGLFFGQIRLSLSYFFQPVILFSLRQGPTLLGNPSKSTLSFAFFNVDVVVPLSTN